MSVAIGEEVEQREATHQGDRKANQCAPEFCFQAPGAVFFN
jgi:hypothetical protein